MTFEGFITPKKNYYHMPNNWTDVTADINNLAELKVVEYIMRHTWGYQEYGIKKAITTDEFMHGRKRNDGTRIDKGTGLSNRSVIDGLRAAEEHGYIESDLDDSDRARKIKYYVLKMAESDVKNLHVARCEESSHRHEGSSHLAEEPSHLGEGSSHRSEKDTLERHFRKTLVERKGEGESDDEEENSSDSPPELTPTQKLVKRINEIHETYDTAMGFSTTWTKENHEGAEILATQGRTDEEITLAIKDIQDDPDQFDLKRMNLKYLSTIIDGRLNAIRQRQSRPQQQFRSPSPARPPFRKPTLIATSLSPGLDLDAIAARQEQDWLREHGAEFGITPESVEAGATS